MVCKCPSIFSMQCGKHRSFAPLDIKLTPSIYKVSENRLKKFAFKPQSNNICVTSNHIFFIVIPPSIYTAL